MCELMGMSFAKPIVANVSIRAFSQRSQENPDGWGLAWYPDRSLAMVKQPLRWSVQHTEFLEHYPGLLSSIYLAHVRQRTTGLAPTHADTHPFSRELLGREYCFAHNGTLSGKFWQQPLGRFRPIGGTDSEYLFCLLLAELERLARLLHDVDRTQKHLDGSDEEMSWFTPLPGPRSTQAESLLATEQEWRWLHQFLFHLNDFGKLNCLLSDGERLVAYHDKNRWKGLSYRDVFVHPDSSQYFGDTQVTVNLQAEPVNHGCIVATNPLSLDGWQRFLPGEMKVLYQGNVVFANHPSLPESAANGHVAKEPPHASAATAAEKLASHS